MKSQELIKTLFLLKKPVFTINDAAKITGKEKAYLKVYLLRLKKRGLIQSAERGKYFLPQNHLLAASGLIYPSYISFLSAYSYYQITMQMPRKIQIVSLRQKKELKLGEYLVQFIKLPRKKLFGYKREDYNDGTLFVAEKEKAIVDSLYLPEYCPLDETFYVLDSGIDIGKLIDYALQMDSIVLLKRLGYLLELKGEEIYPKVKSKLNKRYDLLNPQLKATKNTKISGKWRLIINDKFENDQ